MSRQEHLSKYPCRLGQLIRQDRPRSSQDQYPFHSVMKDRTQESLVAINSVDLDLHALSFNELLKVGFRFLAVGLAGECGRP
jgi:hypothetical protein